MCLIVVKPVGIELPKEEYLEQGAKRNSDGLGLAYLKAGEQIVNIKKDFKTIEELIEFVKTNIKKEDTLVVHFRAATHGLKDEGNRHPFPLSKNKELLRKTELTCKYIMAHNGVLSQYSRLDETELSDSQRFILDILSETAVKENFDKPGIKSLISNFLSGDRLAILNNKGRLWMFGDFHEEEGCYYSNTFFKPVKREYYGGTYQGGCYGREGYSHWGAGGFNQLTHQQKRQAEKPNENKTNNKENVKMVGKCEGCGNKKSVKLHNYKDVDYQLCKRCRKRARKNTLIFKISDEHLIIPKENLKVINTFRCVTCRTYFKPEELTLVWETYSVCESCLEQMKKDPNQSLLFS